MTIRRSMGSSIATVWCVAFVAVPASGFGSALLDAARSGDGPAAARLLEQGAAVDEVGPDGTSALHWAVYHEDADLTARLIGMGADVRRANRYAATPMSEAAITGSRALLEMLLDAGANVESANADGQTALMIVARSSHVDAARLLLDRGANVNAAEQWRGQTALMWAAAQSQPAMMRLLAERGADLGARSAVNDWEVMISAEPRAHYRPPGGWTALLYSARQGCLDCAKVLVEAGADIDTADPEGATALLYAIQNWHFDLAKFLVESGANPNKWDWWGRTPLYAAVNMNTLPEGGRPDRPPLDATTAAELIGLLLAAGANPDARLKLYPVHRSVQNDRGRHLMMTTGATSLLRAAHAFDADAIALLLDYDADPNLPNTIGVTTTQIIGITPIMAAAGLGFRRMDDVRGGLAIGGIQERSIAALQRLVAGGAELNARDAGGRTALHGAASMGWKKVAQFLVESGADPHAADADGVTPLGAAQGRMREGRIPGGSWDSAREETAAYLTELTGAQAKP
jgi:ankyrin repeat protein